MDRKKALDQLRIMQAWHEDNGNGPNADYDAICYAINIIKALPPSQPEPCEDAVSRKGAIDGLNDAVHEHNITDFDAVATILALPSVMPKQRWILCSDRLPNKQTKVLVVDFGEVDTAYLNSEGRWMDFHGDKLKDVKAWMPLPKWEGDAK